MDIFSLSLKEPIPYDIYNELRNAVLLVTALNLRHNDAPDYLNQIRAIADSDSS